MKKRYVLKNKKRFLSFVASLLVMLLLVVSMSSVEASRLGAENYRILSVSRGDTLWDIAREYGANMDIRKYIYKIKKLNKLSSSEIFEGDVLKLPQ